MPAHLRSLTRCQWPGCDKPGEQELRNTWNAVCGTYCKKHAIVALKKFQEEYETD